ncbi:MAG: HAMP domain-containing histidine kinase [Chitinophagaceae bacterium]|nr:HAMP domain-containing histidine kinase [Chitinophagaceae bacterium]
MELLNQKQTHLQQKLRSHQFTDVFEILNPRIFGLNKIIGAVNRNKLKGYEHRKLVIFNQLNIFQLLSGLLIPLVGLYFNNHFPTSAWFIACLPALINLIILALNHYGFFKIALRISFIFYPLFTYIVYLQGVSPGVELHFLLYGVLSVFFLKDLGYMVFAIAFSMMSYFMIAVVLKNFVYQVEVENQVLYMLNQLLSLSYIFYGLYLIKKENTNYQFGILTVNRVLHKKNLKIKKQKREIAATAKLLQEQKEELIELNCFKTKLLSVLAHDLKTPMYAVRNLFSSMHQQNLPADEIKKMLPEVMTDLNYTVSLMENLLEWAKNQMQANATKPTHVNLNKSITDVLQVLSLQARSKKICLRTDMDEPVYAYADNDMINIVLRNILSNAIKFTPSNGLILVGINDTSTFVEVYVRDSGIGISKAGLAKINENNFYTTTGTSSETGTGLGLMLCKEFLTKNGGQLYIQSEEGKGSTISFTLPKC